MLDEGRIIAAIFGGIIGSIVGPFVKNYLDRWTARRNAKTELRPKVYQSLVRHLYLNDLSAKELENLKIKLMVYGKDEILKAFVKVSNLPNEEKLSGPEFKLLMEEIRSNLGMSSNYNSK